MIITLVFKKIILIPVCVILAFTAFGFVCFSSYGSLSDGYQFLYPRNWHAQVIEKNPFMTGLVVSPNAFTGTESDFARGGFILISSSQAENDLTSVEEYINEVKDAESRKMKAGGMPTIPGASQFIYIGGPLKSAPKGFEEVTSLATIGSNTEAHLYWKIENGKLYEIFIKYPDDNSKKYGFELGVRIVANLFKNLI